MFSVNTDSIDQWSRLQYIFSEDASDTKGGLNVPLVIKEHNIFVFLKGSDKPAVVEVHGLTAREVSCGKNREDLKCREKQSSQVHTSLQKS